MPTLAPASRAVAAPPASPASAPAPGAPDAPAPRGRRVRTPTILQMEAVECGAASLAMVLAHHGLYVPLEELRVQCGVSRDGSKASNVLRAARHYGLDAKGFKKEPAALHALPLPMIVHWNFNHFVVLEGFRNGRVFLNDPAGGPIEVSAEQFDQSFTGVALTFETGPAFRRGGEAPSLRRALARRLPRARSALAFVVLAGLALVLPGMIAPAFTRVFVDDILVRGMHAWLGPVLLLMGATAVVAAALTWLQQRYLARLEATLAVRTSAEFFWHVLRLPVGFFTQRSPGDIGNRVASNDRVARLVTGDLASAALGVLVIGFYGLLLARYDALLALVGVAVAVLNVVALRYVSRRRVDLSRRAVQDRGRLIGAAMGGLLTIETLKASGSESQFFARWAGHNAKVHNAEGALHATTRLLAIVPPVLTSVSAAVVLGVGGLRVMDGRMSIGLLVAFQALMTLFLGPVARLVELSGSAQEVKGDLARLDDVLRAPADGAVAALAAPVGAAGGAGAEPGAFAREGAAPRLRGAVELRGLRFGYSPLDPPLIDDFSLTIRPGSRVALVGGSGSGKSTIAKLVAGLQEPWAGEILFDGRPRREVPREVLINSVAVVDQDIAMFEDTIRNNIALWDSTLPDAAIVGAAKDACIHDEIASRAGGYAAMVDEGGRNFSGGQRQRLEIARALAGGPAVLVLDEATSALDAFTEQAIDDALRRRGCTCLIVAHRLSTIRDADEIIVLERGRVVQRGPHRVLSAVDGPYRTLIASE